MLIGYAKTEFHRSDLVLINGASILKVPAVCGNGIEFWKRNVGSQPQMNINRWTLK